MQSRFCNNCFRNLEGFNSFTLILEMQKLYDPLDIRPQTRNSKLFCVFLDKKFFQVNKIFSENAFDAVMHFTAVAYVGESTQFPLK